MGIVTSDDTVVGTHRGSGQAGSKTEEARSPGIETGRLITKQGMSRYLENNLWTSLSDEVQSLPLGYHLRDPKEILQGSSEDEKGEAQIQTASNMICPDGGVLLFASCPKNTSLSALHPQPVYIFRLWQTFLDNVNPLVTLFHAPTMQQLILEASGNLDNVSKGREALIFAIYSSAVTSLSNADCESIIGEAKQALLARYQFGTQQALISAGFLKSSDLAVLQAYVLFLYYDAHSLWILTGVAVRIGQRVGLHRDGASLELPRFEVEMRRRLWWQIVLLDSRTAKLSGPGTSVLANLWDTKLPLNVNDSDLNPVMKELPVEHTGITEMVFCLLRYEVGEFFRHSNSKDAFDGSWQKLSNTAVPPADKDRAIDELERLLENKFLRYCDPLIPLHFISAIVARSAIRKMRFVAHHPRRYADQGAPQKEKNMIFSNSLKMIEYDNLVQSTKRTQKFLWHVNVHFEMDAFVYMLSELRLRTAGDLEDRAWRQVNEVFEHHPEMITETKNALYLGISNLTIKAWEAREAEFARQPQNASEVAPPHFISTFSSQRMIAKAAQATIPLATNASFTGPAEYMSGEQQATCPYQGDGTSSGDISSGLDPPLLSGSLPTESSAMDWAYWDDLLQGCDLQALDGRGQQIFCSE
ncbi:MAG: hypothetical protein M1830_004160 [Pleopsidium flavum]|nr:MAG: hypothetical protein M1830_004160 [Pleopsidium flavum]